MNSAAEHENGARIARAWSPELESESIENLLRDYSQLLVRLEVVEYDTSEYHELYKIIDAYNKYVYALPDLDLSRARAAFTAMASHDSAEVRKTAAASVVRLAEHDRDFATELWIQLAMDEDVADDATKALTDAIYDQLLPPEYLAYIAGQIMEVFQNWKTQRLRSDPQAQRAGGGESSEV